MSSVRIEMDVDDCAGVNNLEHVVSPIHVSSGRKRGDLRIYLISPMGTRSTLLDAGPQDYSSSGYIDWPFMTTHNWGENPRGRWVLEIHNDAYSKWASDAKFFKWSLELYGIRYDPNSQEYIEAQAEKNNNVREAPVIPPSIMMMPGFVSNKNTTTTTTSTTTTTTTELTSSTTTSTTTEY